MKKGNTRSRFQSIIGATLGIVSLVGCSSTETTKVEGSSRLPGAEATVKSSKTENGNTGLDIRVKHLAPVNRITSDATSYVVWGQPINGSGPAQNLGALTVDEDLEGRLRTVTPHRELVLFITPEAVATSAYPTGERVLSATIRE